MGELVRVDVEKGVVRFEELPEDLKLYGGRSLTSAMIAREVDASCDPLGPDNRIVIAPGTLAGTMAPSSGRLSIGCKSPLTGGIKEANAGGLPGLRLGRLGIRAIVVEGDPKGRKWILHLSKDGARLDDGTAFWGKANYECADALRAAYGPKVATIQVGIAGENGLKNSTIACTDPEGRPTRHAARGGVGAVMAARGLKAVVVDDSGTERPSLVDPERFDRARKTLVDGLQSHPVTSQGLTNFGTSVMVNIINEAGAFPTHNFHYGTFEQADAISGETISQNCDDRGGKRSHGCMPGCVIRCSNVYHDKDGNHVSSGVEFESVWALGANCDNGDIDAIARMDRLCDDIGVDTMEMGTTFAVAMEGGLLPWGDAERMIQLFDEIRQNSDLGRKIGNGTVHCAQVYGVDHVPTVKNQGMAAYDPRAIKGMGATYATTPMGADHTAGYSVAPNILKIGGDLDPLKPDSQCAVSQGLQEATAGVFDSTGLCQFLAFACLDQPDSLAAIPEMISARFGVELTAGDLVAQGAGTLETEREFNRRAGMTREDDRLPGFFYTEALPPHNSTWDVPDEELDAVCGWGPLTERV